MPCMKRVVTTWRHPTTAILAYLNPSHLPPQGESSATVIRFHSDVSMSGCAIVPHSYVAHILILLSRFCSCPCAFESLLQEHPFHARNLQQALDALQTMMAQWNSLGTAAMIKTAVANVFEWLVHFGLGAEFSQPFWQDVVAC
eukprot:m.177719 g.177719  ORF g.177719 m.177719 type:complete len:143 (+) comp16822_c0_seq22:4123-4551(+)